MPKWVPSSTSGRLRAVLRSCLSVVTSSTLQAPQGLHVLLVALVVVAWLGLDGHGMLREALVGQQPPEEPLADEALPDVLVPVLLAAQRVLGVVEVERLDALQPEGGVGRVEHGLVAVLTGEVVPGRERVARVDADAHPIFGVDALDDGGQLLEA